MVVSAGLQCKRTQVQFPLATNFRFPLLRNLCSEAVGISNFEFLVEDSDTGGPSSITVRMTYLFAFQI